MSLTVIKHDIYINRGTESFIIGYRLDFTKYTRGQKYVTVYWSRNYIMNMNSNCRLSALIWGIYMMVEWCSNYSTCYMWHHSVVESNGHTNNHHMAF